MKTFEQYGLHLDELSTSVQMQALSGGQNAMTWQSQGTGMLRNALMKFVSEKQQEGMNGQQILAQINGLATAVIGGKAADHNVSMGDMRRYLGQQQIQQGAAGGAQGRPPVV